MSNWIRHVLAFALLAIGIVLSGSPGLRAADLRPVVAAFEPDSSDLSSMPLPNHLLSRDGVNRLPGTSGAVASVNALRGFSTAAPIFVPFRGTVDATTVTEQSVIVMDAARGTRPPMERSVVTYANGDSGLRVEPLTPLTPATRYLVFVTDAVKARDGASVHPSEFLKSMRHTTAENPTTEARRRDYQSIWQAARQHKLDPATVVQAFAFTTQPIGRVLPVLRSRVQKTTPTFTLTDSATTPDAVAALFQKMQAGAFPRAHVGMVFKGTLTSPRYVEDGSTTPIKYNGPDDPVQIGTINVPFVATVPANASGPVPVLVFQHGSYLDKNDVLRIADAAAQAGLAVIGIDAELHGERSAVVDGVRQHSGTNLINLDRPLQLRDIWHQTYNDQYSLVRMIRLGNTRFTGQEPLLATGRVAYMGHSMGGILGGVCAATEPDVAVAVLNVPGAKMRSLLLESGWFAPRFNAEMARRGMLPVTPEYDRFLWMYQTAADDADPFNYGPALKAAQTQVLIQEMFGDDVMPNPCTEALARSIGLTQVYAVRPVIGLAQAAWPFLGSALFQFPGGGHNTIVNPNDGPTRSVHEQGMRFVTSGLKGKAEVISPDIPIPPDLHLDMTTAPGDK